ncbi:hypothetical protein BDV95DRAFT_611904 [Massariosphaeria phaeospora]|uniref:Clr5 domain-containing protein n=1 Tax=Massariosphaeria phaeospora TaxID=100035 RepID=A0A7C8I402_9PLEO|nr:hypothetical protein BDV95DRAFT_611904 [Massariosphaeria phaeospora]
MDAKKPRAPEYPAHVWEGQRQRFTRLYRDENRKLADVRKMLRDEGGFDATEKQYKRRIKQWKLEKNSKASEKQQLLRVWRSSNWSMDVSSDMGKAIAPHKLRRYARSQGFNVVDMIPDRDTMIFEGMAKWLEDTKARRAHYPSFWHSYTIVYPQRDWNWRREALQPQLPLTMLKAIVNGPVLCKRPGNEVEVQFYTSIAIVLLAFLRTSLGSTYQINAMLKRVTGSLADWKNQLSRSNSQVLYEDYCQISDLFQKIGEEAQRRPYRYTDIFYEVFLRDLRKRSGSAGRAIYSKGMPGVDPLPSNPLGLENRHRDVRSKMEIVADFVGYLFEGMQNSNTTVMHSDYQRRKRLNRLRGHADLPSGKSSCPKDPAESMHQNSNIDIVMPRDINNRSTGFFAMSPADVSTLPRYPDPWTMDLSLQYMSSSMDTLTQWSPAEHPRDPTPGLEDYLSPTLWENSPELPQSPSTSWLVPLEEQQNRVEEL